MAQLKSLILYQAYDLEKLHIQAMIMEIISTLLTIFKQVLIAELVKLKFYMAICELSIENRAVLRRELKINKPEPI